MVSNIEKLTTDEGNRRSMWKGLKRRTQQIRGYTRLNCSVLELHRAWIPSGNLCINGELFRCPARDGLDAPIRCFKKIWQYCWSLWHTKLPRKSYIHGTEIPQHYTVSPASRRRDNVRVNLTSSLVFLRSFSIDPLTSYWTDFATKRVDGQAKRCCVISTGFGNAFVCLVTQSNSCTTSYPVMISLAFPICASHSSSSIDLWLSCSQHQKWVCAWYYWLAWCGSPLRREHRYRGCKGIYELVL